MLFNIIHKKNCGYFCLLIIFLWVNFQKLSAQYHFKETENLVEKYKNNSGGIVSSLIYKDGK